jgi:hypothetical protein
MQGLCIGEEGVTRSFLEGAVLMADIEYAVTYTGPAMDDEMIIVGLFTTYCDADEFAKTARIRLATSGTWSVEEITD